MSQTHGKDTVSRIIESDNEDDISIKRESFNYPKLNTRLEPVKGLDFEKNYQLDKAFKKKPAVFQMNQANRTVKDQSRNIFFSTHANLKKPIQKGTAPITKDPIENSTIQHDYLKQLQEQDKIKAERMNSYIRNLKNRLHGRELVTQSNFFQRKTPDLDGVLTLTKFGFSSGNHNAGSPGIKRNTSQNKN
jgi:hypothetical protein